MTYRHLVLIAITFLTLIACNRVKETILPHTSLIFPQDSGLTRVYYVIDTSYNTAGIDAPIVEEYAKKEVQGGTESDLTGRDVRFLDIYSAPWPIDTGFAFTYSHRATQFLDPVDNSDYFGERKEDNVLVQVLKFPVSAGVSWNGNAFNNIGTKVFSYLAVDSTVTVQGKSYENCVVVINQERTNSFIEEAFAYEIYAPEIGLIKKYEKRILNDGPNREFNPDKSGVYIEELLDHN